MPISRSAIKTGPAIVTFNSAKFYFKSGLKLVEEIETFEITNDTYGKVDERIKDRKATVSGTPVGEWENLSTLFPWLTTPIGTRLRGDTDKAMVIHCLDGTVYTYHNAAMPDMPKLKFSAIETLLGEVKWDCRVKDNTDPTAANSLFTRSTASFTDTSFSSAAILTQPYTLGWGASPWDSFGTVDGVEVSFGVKWQPITLDGVGEIDSILDDVSVEATFRPLGIPQADIDAKLLLQGSASAALGSSLSARGATFSLTGTGVYVALYGAACKSYEQEFGMGKLRNGALKAIATRTFTSGVANPLAYVGTAAP